MTDRPQTLLSTTEAMEYLGVSRGTLYRLVKAGALPTLRIGRQLRFDRDHLTPRRQVTRSDDAPITVDAWRRRLRESNGVPFLLLFTVPEAYFEKDGDDLTTEHVRILRVAEGSYQVYLKPGDEWVPLGPQEELMAAQRFLVDAMWILVCEQPDRFGAPVVEELYEASLALFHSQIQADYELWRQKRGGGDVAK